jgi:hypothetical protein
MFEIEHDVPPPACASVRRYPWREMAIGDSFVLPAPHSNPWAMAANAGRKYGMRFVTRTVKGGWRIWRVG